MTWIVADFTLETFRFEDENDYEYEISLYVFKIDTPDSFIVLFSIRKDSTVIYTEGGLALSRSDVLMTTTFSLKLVVECRRLPSFPAKLTPAYTRALLSIEEISSS